MTNLVPDPLVPGGIANFGQRLRAGDVTAEAVTEAYLARIEALDEHVGAYQHVAADRAREVARAVDKLLAAGTDFGPLMGVPVAIKDIIEVEGMPTTAGSRMETADLIGPEGGFVRRLKQAGCVILGKTKTVEFALGGSGTNWNFGTPRNPWDSKVHRVTAGSSSGSAAAMAAGMCGFAVGTDTGGSIRGPAAMCGVFGLKPTTGIWPADGLFAVSKTLDVIGPLTRSAADATIVLGALTGQEAPRPARLKGLRIGRPVNFFFDDLDEHVSSCIDAAIGALAAEGVEVIEVDVPEIHENIPVFANISRPEIIAFIGRERFEAERNNINADVWDRAAPGLEVTADAYARSLWRHRELCALSRQAMSGLDAWVAPNKQRVAPPYPGVTSVEGARALVGQTAGPTRPANVFGMCASSTPVQAYGSELPVGMQLLCPGGEDLKLMSIAQAVEAVVGLPPTPKLSDFVDD